MRDYAAKLAEKETLSSSEAVEQARKQGMAEMSEKFRALGGEVYVTRRFEQVMTVRANAGTRRG